MRIDPRPRDRVVGVALAVAAGLHKAILTSTPVNDDYQHLAYARQVIGGELPLRDFWDISTTLQHGLSAVSQVVFGQRLLSEAILVGVATAVAVYLVFRVLQQATGSAWVALVCAGLFLVAIPRVYAYPKWIVYALATSLWWSYVWWPSTRQAIAAGLSVAVAFYWRHDHGGLVAVGVLLGMVAAHGFTSTAMRRTAMAGLTALGLVLPYLVFAAAQLGPLGFVRLELTSFVDEHERTRATLRWPLRALEDVFRRETQDAYAPEISVRWNASLRPEERAAALRQYGLTPMAADGAQAQRVRLSEQSLGSLRALIDDNRIDDTAGVERGSGSFTWSQWAPWDRVRFQVAALRFTLLPGIDQQIVAGVTAAMIVQAIPLFAALLAGPSLRRLLPPAVTPRSLLLFAAFAALVNFGLLRDPYESRVADVIVLPVILLGVLLTVLLRGSYPPLVRWPLRGMAVVVMLLMVKSLAVAGDFGDRMSWLLGEGQLERARGAWREVGARLQASPPSQFWPRGTGPVTVRLAEYARRCTAPSDRILVLWFAPEIHYHADRLMAGRHLYYFAAFRTVEDEQRRELDKVMRTEPVMVLVSRNGYPAALAAFPGLESILAARYTSAVRFEEDGDAYSILLRKDSQPRSTDSVSGWPCLT
jgi:hypothetical protein